MFFDANGNLLIGNADVSCSSFNGAFITSAESVDVYLNGTGRYTPLAKANINNNAKVYIGDLSTTPSKFDLASIITSPVEGEVYSVNDTFNHMFLVYYKNNEFYYEELKKAI
jgi:hypothetical protein